MKLFKNEGITLIALVITVIVLLILAGVSIAMLTGENGILSQAQRAKNETEEAQASEEITIGQYETYINKATGNNAIVGEIVTGGNKPYTNNGTAIIPEGFAIVPGCDDVSKGLVISDIANDTENSGNQFVWVPVEDINTMAQCSTAGGDCNLELEGTQLKCITHSSTEIVGKIYGNADGESFGNANIEYEENGYREPAYLKSEIDGDASSNNKIGLTEELIKSEYKNMIISVALNAGFYVGRYETSLSDATSTTEGTNGKAQSKANVIPVSAANSSTSTWYGLYKIQKEYAEKNSRVGSSMIWGSQYDEIMNWAKEGEDSEKIHTTTNAPHNLSDPYQTGSQSNDIINNIYDLEGNLCEWTLEAFENQARMARGSYYGASHTPSVRYGGKPWREDETRGSRMILYIK